MVRATNGEPVDLVLHGGRVALPGGVAETAIAVRGERIVAVGEPDALPPAREYLDLSGKDVIPGAIDAHSHLGFDDWDSLSRCSAHGGLTTIISFVGTPRDAGIGETVRENRAAVERDAVLDCAFHAFLFPRGDDPMTVLSGLPEGVEQGVRSYKMFMAYPRDGRMCGDDFLFRAFRELTALGALPMVHAENGHLIDALEDRLIEEGKTGFEYYHDSRPPEAEAEAIERAAALAAVAGSPLYVVHLSTGLGLDAIRARQQAGQRVWTETCPQYLALSDDDLLRRRAFAKIAPPLRRPDNVAAMWRGLSEGWIPVVASDHSPHDPALKALATENVFRLPDGRSVPFGMPGAETIVPVLYSEGVVKRGLPLSWLARVLGENPARLFGLYPRKGRIAPGADADLTVLDPSRTVTVSAADLHSRTGYTVYEGKEVQGWPSLTLLRGQVLLQDGLLRQAAGYGRYQPAGAFAPPLLGPALWDEGVPAAAPAPSAVVAD
jgi:dihydropyrimidinase